ncbi:hypothetical protein HK096_003495 [Nowakowskiella sp. JEL0078]|nr:hypothetical protein HK096_003495 [Nowakowskiella sp. JEL0078]
MADTAADLLPGASAGFSASLFLFPREPILLQLQVLRINTLSLESDKKGVSRHRRPCEPYAEQITADSDPVNPAAHCFESWKTSTNFYPGNEYCKVTRNARRSGVLEMDQQ